MNIIVVSGGSSGIGQACVEKFLTAGDFVYNLDIVNRDELVGHENYKYLFTDVTSKDNIQQSIVEILNESSRIDVLITSAGKHLSANIENTTDEQLMNLLYLNLLGTYWLIQSSIPIMKKNKQGKIITIGSDQCTIAKKNSAVYGMTKSALLSLTKTTALDYAQDNIRVNCIGAGTIDTPLYRHAIKRYSQTSNLPLSAIEEEEAKQQPVGRIGKAEEVAELAYFLASDKSNFITGALLPIDGGYTAK